jgi:DNA-binding NarL/FixJ family response regulator
VSPRPAEAVIRVGILLVHDHELLADAVGVALGLDPEIRIVAVETEPEAGLLRVIAAGPEVIILDSLPLAARLHAEHPESRLIALCAAGDQSVILACIRAGVDACIGMNTSPAMLGEMIKRVHAGEALYEPRALLELLQRPHMTIAAQPRRTASLAQRELEVLTAIAMGLSSAEAADYLCISINTLRTHVKNIIAKLGARSKLDAVLIAIREGRIELPGEAD